MKTTNTLRLLAAALLLSAAATTRADYTSLTVKETAGTWTSFGLKGLKVTFSADNITVANTEMKQTYPIGDVWSLQLTDLPTGINGATTDGQSSDFIVSTDRGRISVTAQLAHPCASTAPPASCAPRSTSTAARQPPLATSPRASTSCALATKPKN